MTINEKYTLLVDTLAEQAHAMMFKINGSEEAMDGDQTEKLSQDFLIALDKLNGNI